MTVVAPARRWLRGNPVGQGPTSWTRRCAAMPVCGRAGVGKLASNFHEFADRAIRLVDGAVSVGRETRVGIGNNNTPEGLPCEEIGAVLRVVVRVPKRVVLRRVAVRPAIDGNPFDVAYRIETGSGEHACELVADIAFERCERRCEKLHATEA